MARPIKRGLDYFPLDTNYYDDEKLTDLTLEFGYLAELVYIRVLALVYRNGYYLEMNVNTLSRLIRRSLIGKNKPPSIEVFEKLIIALSKYDLIDKEMLNKNVITSKGIQKQYVSSTNRRKNNNFTKYIILSNDEMIESKKYINNEEQKSESKYKLQKETILHSPKKHFITKGLINGGYIQDGDLNVKRYNELIFDLISEYGYDIVLAVSNYIVKYNKRKFVDIDDKFDFFRTSSINNCKKLKRQQEKGDIDYEKEVCKFFETMDK